MHNESFEPVPKPRTTKGQRFFRLLEGALDPRAWIHGVKLINFYNYTHVRPLRQVTRGPGCAISPNASFTHPERIHLGARVTLGARVALWAGPAHGRIEIGDDTLFAPDVMVIATNYRFDDGQPVTKQAMDEADVVIGRDVWLGAKVVVLAGARIGDGTIVAAGAVVRGEFPPMSIIGGVPAKVIGQRQLPDPLPLRP